MKLKKMVNASNQNTNWLWECIVRILKSIYKIVRDWFKWISVVGKSKDCLPVTEGRSLLQLVPHICSSSQSISITILTMSAHLNFHWFTCFAFRIVCQTDADWKFQMNDSVCIWEVHLCQRYWSKYFLDQGTFYSYHLTHLLKLITRGTSAKKRSSQLQAASNKFARFFLQMNLMSVWSWHAYLFPLKRKRMT